MTCLLCPPWYLASSPVPFAFIAPPALLGPLSSCGPLLYLCASGIFFRLGSSAFLIPLCLKQLPHPLPFANSLLSCSRIMVKAAITHISENGIFCCVTIASSPVSFQTLLALPFNVLGIRCLHSLGHEQSAPPISFLSLPPAFSSAALKLTSWRQAEHPDPVLETSQVELRLLSARAHLLCRL